MICNLNTNTHVVRLLSMITAKFAITQTNTIRSDLNNLLFAIKICGQPFVTLNFFIHSISNRLITHKLEHNL